MSFARVLSTGRALIHTSPPCSGEKWRQSDVLSGQSRRLIWQKEAGFRDGAKAKGNALSRDLTYFL